MKYNELTVKRQRKVQRVGRGISAGRGKTAGRGTKGQGSRKSPIRAGFEGGQMPLYMRLPKLRGFKSHRPTIETVYTGQLDKVSGATVDTTSLHKAGLISNPHVSVKLIVKGDLRSKKTVKLPRASQTAIAAIKKAGGTYERVEQLGRPTTKKPKDQ